VSDRHEDLLRDLGIDVAGDSRDAVRGMLAELLEHVEKGGARG